MIFYYIRWISFPVTIHNFFYIFRFQIVFRKCKLSILCSINMLPYLETSIRNPTGGKKRPDLNMFPHIDLFRFFSWVLGYIDTSHAKKNYVAIFSRSSHKCPRLHFLCSFALYLLVLVPPAFVWNCRRIITVNLYSAFFFVKESQTRCVC